MFANLTVFSSSYTKTNACVENKRWWLHLYVIIDDQTSTSPGWREQVVFVIPIKQQAWKIYMSIRSADRARPRPQKKNLCLLMKIYPENCILQWASELAIAMLCRLVTLYPDVYPHICEDRLKSSASVINTNFCMINLWRTKILFDMHI